MRHFRPLLRLHDLTEQQWRILRALAANGPTEVAALAQASFLLGPSLSRILKDLEERQLIHRRSQKDDLRRAIVAITAKGLTLIRIIAPKSEAIYMEMTQRFGARKLAQLQALLLEFENSALELSLGRKHMIDPVSPVSTLETN